MTRSTQQEPQITFAAVLDAFPAVALVTFGELNSRAMEGLTRRFRYLRQGDLQHHVRITPTLGETKAGHSVFVEHSFLQVDTDGQADGDDA